MNFWRFINIIKTRIWLIAGVVVATLLVIALAVPKPRIVYKANAYMMPTQQVMQGGVTTAGGEANSSKAPDREVILSNLILLAQGGEVYEKAMDFLALPVEEQKKLAPGLPSYLQITRIEIKKNEPLTYRDWPDVLEVSPMYNTSVGEQGTTTDIIRITAKLQAGEYTPYLANAVAWAFSQVFQEKSREDVNKYIKFLESRKEKARIELERLQEEMAAYKQRSNVLSIDVETQNAIQSLAALEAERNAAQAQMQQAQAAVRDIRAQLARQPLVRKNTLPADMNPRIQELKKELANAEAQKRMLLQRYTPEHEQVKAIESHISLIKERIEKEGSVYTEPVINEIHQELRKKLSEAEYEYASARAKFASINGSFLQAQSKLQNIARSEPKLVELVREYTQAENTYKLISEKLSQTLIAQEEFTKTGSITPYGWAIPDGVEEEQEGPSRKVVLVYGLFLACILGIAAAVWLDSIDMRMRNAADVEKLLELPVMGLTPKLTGRDGVLPKLTHIYPLSAMAESYRILRTNILFALRDKPFKTLMVATGRPGQGATTTICNLAIALAQIGKKIILIDADMRRPSLHKFFGVPNDAGLSTLLMGTSSVEESLQKTEIENLIVVPAGPQPLNPSELLGSEKMRELVERLEEHCDLILFDTPSTVVFSDGPMLASWIDSVLMVVSANQAPRGTERQTRDLLRRAKANIIGVVVNRMSPDNVDSCFYYSHYYASSVPQPGDKPALNNPDKSKKPELVSDSKKDAGGIASKPETKKNNEENENPFPD